MWVVLQIGKKVQSRKVLSWRENVPCQSVVSLCFIVLEQLSISTLTAKGLQLCGTPPAFPREMVFIYTGDSRGSGSHEQAS